MALRHFGAMMIKRYKYFKRDPQSWCCQIVMPILLLVFGIYVYNVGSNNQPPTHPLISRRPPPPPSYTHSLRTLTLKLPPHHWSYRRLCTTYQKNLKPTTSPCHCLTPPAMTLKTLVAPLGWCVREKVCIMFVLVDW